MQRARDKNSHAPGGRGYDNRKKKRAKRGNRPPHMKSPELFIPTPQEVISLASALLKGPVIDRVEREGKPSSHQSNVVREGLTLVHKDHPDHVVRIDFLGRRGRHSDATSSLRRGRLPLPPRLFCWTRFQKQVSINQVGFAQSNVVFDPVYCYDVDPTIGSTSMPFFFELMSLYRYYRTINSKISVTFTNKESAPATVYVFPYNTLGSANFSSGIVQSFLSNPLSKQTEISPTGGMDHATIKSKQTTAGFAGARWTGTPDDYASFSSVSPVNHWSWIVGYQMLTASVNGITANVVIDIEFCAFEENAPPS